MGSAKCMVLASTGASPVSIAETGATASRAQGFGAMREKQAAAPMRKKHKRMRDDRRARLLHPTDLTRPGRPLDAGGSRPPYQTDLLDCTATMKEPADLAFNPWARRPRSGTARRW
jgi:hypothetical protein